MNDQAEFEVGLEIFFFWSDIYYLDKSTNSIEWCLSKRLCTFNSMVSKIKWISSEIYWWNESNLSRGEILSNQKSLNDVYWNLDCYWWTIIGGV
jgi:hypothetical protein